MSSLPSDRINDYDNHKSCKNHQEILERQSEEEAEAGHYSREFSTLLPGMKVVPLCLIPKKDSVKMRVCSDMSYGSLSPNSLVDKSKIKISMDSLISFAHFLIDKKKKLKNLILWKSDIDNTYRTLPMCFQWQARKAVRIRKRFRIDRCCDFRSSGSPKLWCSFWSLVLWIAEFVLGIKGMNNLMDDTWGVCFASELISFKGRKIPIDQAKLLNLFDFVGVP